MDGVSGHQAFERLLDEYRDKVFRLACTLLAMKPPPKTPLRRFPQDLEGAPELSRRIVALHLDLRYRPQYLPQRRRIAADRRTFSLDEANAAEIPSHEPPAASDTDLRAAIGRLPPSTPACCAVLPRDRSYQQVALALDLPMGTVKTYLHRAKKELALLLAAQTTRKETPSHGLP